MISKKHFIEELELMHRDVVRELIARIGKAKSIVLVKQLEHYKNTVIEIAEKQPTVAKPVEWIPCSERLPVLNVEDKSVDRKQSFERDGYLFPFDIGKEFLVTDKYGHVHPSTFWLIEKAFDDVNAIAWMELPEPWKGE